MGLPARKLATYDDLYDLPENYVGEIIAGELYASPRPAAPHARAASALGMDLGTPFDRGRGGPGGWWIVDEPELLMGGDVVVPDLAGWRRERMPAFPDVAQFTLTPDWLCEVLSPSTARLDRTVKLPVYAREGVPYVWLVDPLARTLEVLHLSDGRWVILGTYGGDRLVRAEPFDAVELDLSALWLPMPERKEARPGRREPSAGEDPEGAAGG